MHNDGGNWSRPVVRVSSDCSHHMQNDIGRSAFSDPAD